MTLVFSDFYRSFLFLTLISWWVKRLLSQVTALVPQSVLHPQTDVKMSTSASMQEHQTKRLEHFFRKWIKSKSALSKWETFYVKVYSHYIIIFLFHFFGIVPQIKEILSILILYILSWLTSSHLGRIYRNSP